MFAFAHTPTLRPVSRAIFATTALLGAVLASSPPAAAAPPPPQDFYLQDVPLGSGVVDDIHLRILSNPRPHCHAHTVLAIHGAAATGSTLEPLAVALFAESSGRDRVCRFITMDLPGHGLSGFPVGTLYGALSLDDYAEALAGVLDVLAASYVRPDTLIGHSMGGLVIQILQRDLLASGSSLHAAYDIDDVTLFASAVPRAIPCAFCTNPATGAMLGQFITVSPDLGTVFSIPDQQWPWLVFAAREGYLASDAPTPALVTARDYNSPESLTALAQLTGTASFERPDVPAGIFARHHRTRLQLVAFEHDGTVLPAEDEALYHHLTSRRRLDNFTIVTGANAVHGMPISNPVEILNQLDDDSCWND